MPSLKDFATGTVAVAPSPATTGTSLTLQTGEGARMPTPPFYATAHPAAELPTLDNAEKIQVTNISGDTLTIVRAQGDTTAKSIGEGWRVSNALFAADIFSGSYTDLSNKPTIPTNNNQLTNGAGYITSYTETDPVYAASAAASITFGDITNLGNLSGTNTGDQDLTGLVPKTTTVAGHALSTNVVITASDVGLGNVDNTSDATKNSAIATITNKDLTSATNTFPTFNQDTTGNAATATQLKTARTINGVSFNGTANVTVPGLVWSVKTASLTGAANNGYIMNGAAQLVLTLPATFAVGTTIRVAGMGAGGWKIAQPTGDNIIFGNQVTTTGTSGYLASTNANDTVELLCTVANTTWTVISSVGNITIV
ncbi:MAG TPA: hypothetical protein VFL85_01510 [Candidatus Saccharimonadales bacterium]|nr:hypothetical protein [Candidatus Saccharimonadales bacterium]